MNDTTVKPAPATAARSGYRIRKPAIVSSPQGDDIVAESNGGLAHYRLKDDVFERMGTVPLDEIVVWSDPTKVPSYQKIVPIVHSSPTILHMDPEHLPFRHYGDWMTFHSRFETRPMAVSAVVGNDRHIAYFLIFYGKDGPVVSKLQSRGALTNIIGNPHILNMPNDSAPWVVQRSREKIFYGWMWWRGEGELGVPLTVSNTPVPAIDSPFAPGSIDRQSEFKVEAFGEPALMAVGNRTIILFMPTDPYSIVLLNESVAGKLDRVDIKGADGKPLLVRPIGDAAVLRNESQMQYYLAAPTEAGLRFCIGEFNAAGVLDPNIKSVTLDVGIRRPTIARVGRRVIVMGRVGQQLQCVTVDVGDSQPKAEKINPPFGQAITGDPVLYRSYGRDGQSHLAAIVYAEINHIQRLWYDNVKNVWSLMEPT